MCGLHPPEAGTRGRGEPYAIEILKSEGCTHGPFPYRPTQKLTDSHGLTRCPSCLLIPQCAVFIRNVLAKEVERLRAAGLKGVQRIRVKDKDYDIDLGSYKTVKDAGEWAGTMLPLCLSAVLPALLTTKPECVGACGARIS
jgi:hypothetical protein